MTIIDEMRRVRIANIAIFDLVSSIIGMVLLSMWLRTKYFKTTNIYLVVIIGILLTIPVGIVVHKIFGIKTTINNWIFG